MAGLLELREDSVEQLKFTSSTPDEVVHAGARTHLSLDFFEHEGMVTQLAQLHKHVAQTTHTGLLSTRIVDHDPVVCSKLLVQLSLQSREVALDNALLLVGKILLDISLQATQHEGTQDRVETTNDEQLFFF